LKERDYDEKLIQNTNEILLQKTLKFQKLDVFHDPLNTEDSQS
jgi:hypothetical protein